MIEEDAFLENLTELRQNIAKAALESGRKPEDITLVAATKMNQATTIAFAIQNGITVCGENRVQELLEKDAQGAFSGATLQFIGRLQKNKVKHLVGRVDLIQSVDSLSLAEEINKRALALSVVQNVLLEVNIGNEASKTGFSPVALSGLMEKLSQLKGISVRGIMTIPPKIGENESNFEFFLKMHHLFLDISAETYDNIHMEILSMGMSDDYYEAILAGSTMVRIGSGLFGARSYL